MKKNDSNFFEKQPGALPSANPDWLRFTIVSIAFSMLTIFLGYYARRADFLPLTAAFIAFSLIYVAQFWSGGSNVRHFQRLIWLGIALRVLLLGSIPNLSDDVYRFIWDGRLWTNGIHPFAYTPDAIMRNFPILPGINSELYAKLNSPGYYSVYPPVCQFVFRVAAWLSQDNIGWGIGGIKLFLFGCEYGSIFLLKRLASSRQAALYAINPLVILEITGNCHFEGAVICFVLIAVWALGKNKIAQAALFLALATASKLLPLLFLPIIWRNLGLKKGLLFMLYFSLISLLLFFPLLDVQILQNMASSLDLYFQQFQFNASVYYLIRAIGFWQLGWDIGEFLGPILALLTFAGVLIIAWFTGSGTQKQPGRLTLADAMFGSVLLYLHFSATVHPWYITPLFALSLLTNTRLGIAWSLLAFLSYSHYHDGLFEEQYALIALEYSVLWVLMYGEWRRRGE